jgi:hypothetical protein
MSLRWAVGVMDDKELFGDGLLTVFKTISCFLVLNFEFYFIQRCSTKVASSFVIRSPSCKDVSEVVGKPLAILFQGVRRYSQPSGKFVIGCKMVLATL